LCSASSGTFVSLIQAPAIALGSIHDVGQRAGLFMTVLSVGALAGPPISGAINAATDGFVASGAYAGEC
jgi:MCP family monocarboxylic acid transporter-like MFS transporter 10